MTGWRINTTIVNGIPERLKVMRGGPTSFQVVGESATEVILPGQEIFRTRIPVRAGDRLGTFSDANTFVCPGVEGDVLGTYDGDVPVVRLDAFPVVLKRSVLLLVSASSTSSVSVSGQVSWKPKRGHGARGSKRAGKPRVKSAVAKLSGGELTVEPGAIARFDVELPGSVKRALARLSRGRSIKGTRTASATDAAGRESSRTVVVRLGGRRKKHKAPQARK